MMKTIIIAPHADDEIIGCFEIFGKHPTLVLFPTEQAWKEAQKASELFGFTREILTEKKLDGIGKNDILFFPDPTTEFHPLHKQIGAIGLIFLKAHHHNIFFYTTNMNAPYLRETKDPIKKRDALNAAYPEKQALWEYDHKYFLFEGQVKWIQSWED